MNENSEVFKRLSRKLFQKLLRLELNRLGAHVRRWLLCWDYHFGPWIKPMTKKRTTPYPLDSFLSELAKIPDGSGDKGLLSALMRTVDFPNSSSIFTVEQERAWYWPRSTQFEVAMGLARRILETEIRRTKAPRDFWLLTWDDDLGICVQKEGGLPGLAFSFLDTLKAFSAIPADSGQYPELTAHGDIRHISEKVSQWPKDTLESRVLVAIPESTEPSPQSVLTPDSLELISI